MAFPSSVISLVLLLPVVLAKANNWDIPCFGGKCAYDMVQSGSQGLTTGSLLIAGSPSAISDITPAAGWTILDCDATKTAQTIRAICTGTSSECAHLYQGGAEGTLVRLPETCGKMSFARVVEEWTHEDQSVPSSVAAQLARRDGTSSTVRGITIDTNFAAVDPSQNGNVTMFLQGSTGNAGNFTVAPSDSLTSRSWWDDIVDDALDALSFDISDSDTKDFSYDKTFTLFDQSISCPASGIFPAFSGEFKVEVEAKADFQVAYGLAAVGSIIPPEIDDFGLFVNLDATLDGILTVDANANANIGTGTIPVYSLNLPGLDFAGILSLSVSFEVTAEADASVSADADLTVDLAYTISGAKLFFPPSKGSSSGIFTPATTNLQLTANPVGTASGSVNAQLTPTIQLSIDAFDGVASADVFLNAAATGNADLSLNGNGVAGTSNPAAASFSGCVDVTAGLNVNAGADADFFGLWDPSTSVSLFDKSFDLYNKCFSGSTKKRGARMHARDIQKRGLSCPVPAGTVTSTVVSTAIPSTSIKAQ